MSRQIFPALLWLFLCATSILGEELPREISGALRAPNPSVMSDAYYQIWNDEVQKQIDERIEKYRKADAVVSIENVKLGTDIRVEQISHEFIFGAHIFNFNQLGTDERNEKYKALYGTFFNSATVAFYWQKFEIEPGKPRFATEERDTAEFWNNCPNPKSQPHWRRPSSDQVVEFCESKGIRIHGHPLVWGNRTWHHPGWLWTEFASPEERKNLGIPKSELYKRSADEIYAMGKGYIDALDSRTFERIRIIADHYGDRVDSWDVVNESASDYHGNTEAGGPVCKSSYGLMPADYTIRSFRVANEVFPKQTLLNINDYANSRNYVEQTKELLKKGCKIDIIGSQMHLFNPRQTLDIAEGKTSIWFGGMQMTPDGIWRTMEMLSETGLPIHLSEITITAPNDDPTGRDIQAIVARNFYRMWFSIPNMMGITWWNVVDDCGAPGEPTTSGLFTRNMEPKPSFYALNQLINHEWKTNLVFKADKSSMEIPFRGFKGTYRVRWIDSEGNAQQKEIVVH
ncbi:MAG: endo-1,4-beta-xylanase [Planctomycetia bacterium]|nr:endo-1,4-beta-xylanase [Planctomycetia bacterium]